MLRSTRGQAFVETAISAVLLLGITFAVIDAGMLMYVYLTLENGITEATRFAVTGGTLTDPANPGTQLSRPDSIKLAMRMQSPGITIPDAEFAFQNITTGTADAGGPNDVIRVTVTHPYRPLFPLFRTMGNDAQFRLTVSSTMKNEPPAT